MKIKFKRIKIDTGSHLLIKLSVNGIPALFVIDTGASNTVIDQSKSEKYLVGKSVYESQKLSSGLGTNQMKSSIIKRQNFQIGNLIFKHPLVILDLSHINQSYTMLGHKPIDGVLGCDVLLKYNAVLNLKNKELTLRK